MLDPNYPNCTLFPLTQHDGQGDEQLARVTVYTGGYDAETPWHILPTRETQMILY
jgi:hypothetical protein